MLRLNLLIYYNAIAGFNAVFHDRDEGVTNYFAAMSPGLSPFKNPAQFRRIRLVER